MTDQDIFNEVEDEINENEVTEEVISIEDRARAMGWKPKEEYRGPPERWTTAEQFVAHGEAELPILRDQTRRMSEKLARFEREMEDQKKVNADAITLARRAHQAGYDRALAELEAQKLDAVDLADRETVRTIDAKIDAIKQERAASDHITVPIAKPDEQGKPNVDRETEEFWAANPWFFEKPILKNAMISAHQAIMTAHPEWPLATQYEQAKAEVKEAFPQYFPSDTPSGRPRLRVAAALTPSVQAGAPRRGGSPFDKIADPSERAEAKAAFERMQRNQTDFTAEEYVTLYLNPKADVLALRAQRRKG